MFCSKCGNELPDDANFCDKCGEPAAGVPNDRAAGDQAPPDKPETQAFSFSASGASGEEAHGSIGNAALSSVSDAGPGKVIAAGFNRLTASIASAFKEPKRLIPAIVTAVIWLVLNILKACGIEPAPAKILSFLTFANGGLSGGLIGAVGGIIGKGVFVGALVSLIGSFARKGGEKRSPAETLKGAFGFSADSLWAYLCGMGAAMLLYLFISGGALRSSFMGGAAASFLAARAALKNGFLSRLLGSFTKSKNTSSPNIRGIIRGIAAGFAAAALIGLSNIRLILIIIGSLLLLGGAVMMALQAAGVIKLGKEAQAK